MLQLFRKGSAKGDKFDGTNVAEDGKWISTSSGVLLPPGVYFSPTYSKPLPREDGAVGSMIGEGNISMILSLLAILVAGAAFIVVVRKGKKKGSPYTEAVASALGSDE